MQNKIERRQISKEEAWNFALGMMEIDGAKPDEEFLKLVEMEKRGEITTEEIIHRLNLRWNENLINKG